MSCGAQNGELDCLSVLKIAPYHTLKFGGIGKLAYLCIVIQERLVHPAKSTFNIQH